MGTIIWRSCLILLALAPASGVSAADFAAAASPSRIAGTVTYTGAHGPVSRNRTLCVCVYIDPDLRFILTCAEVDVSGGSYSIQLVSRTFYLVAFLDP